MTEGPARRGRAARRRRLRTGTVCLVALVVAAVTAVAARGYGGADEVGSEPAARLSTVEVKRATLVDEISVKGRLDYGPPVPVALAGIAPGTAAPGAVGGTLTWMPAVGTPVRRGQALFRVDDQPVVLLYGSIPPYRTLAPKTQGRDVEQFEKNLRALGYRGFTADRTYSAETAAAVRRWQKWMGRQPTGSVEPGHVVYATGEVRIAEQRARTGAAATGEVLAYTARRKVATVDVEAGKVSWAKRGREVAVVLPDGRSVAGTIASVGARATEPVESPNAPADPSGATGAPRATVAVVVTIADQEALKAYESSPIEVRYTAEERRDVLTVPVAALLALAEGGYGLEIVEGDGRRIVAVEVGMFADARVEIRAAEIVEGTRIGVPE